MKTRLFIIFFSCFSLSVSSQIDTLRLGDEIKIPALDTGKIVVLKNHTYKLSGAINGNFKGKAVFHFHLGTRNGLSTWYWHNGEKKIEENYKDGQREGESKFYGLDGKLENYFVYKNGICKSSINYYPDGVKASESARDSNVYYQIVRQKNGLIKYTEYGYNDSIVIVNYYENGKIKDKDLQIIKTQKHYSKLWDKKGKLIKEKEWQNERFNLKVIIHEPKIVKRNDEYRNW